MAKNTYNERELRLECVKIASATAGQLKAAPAHVIPFAQQLYDFVTKEEVVS